MNFPDFNVMSLATFGGLFCFIAYTISKGDKSNLCDAATSYLAGTGIVGGCYVCLISLNKFVCENPGLEEHRSCVFMGGAAVLWLSAVGVREKLKKCPGRVPIVR